MNSVRRLTWAILAAVVALVWAGGAGEVPRVLPAGELPKDSRLGPLKDLDGFFPFEVPETLLAWRDRAARVRDQIRVTLGLWPEPTRTPLNAVMHGLVEREDYTVEKVYFESLPGFFVTGNLYRPKGQSGPRPAMLCPHGHWPDGRFLDSGAEAVVKEIAAGAEQFEEGGRSVLQARCVGLARLGCVVFHYDMLGYADSVQIPMEIAHGFAKARPEMATVENWGLFSAPAETHAQSIMGLQTWNSIRALDFVTSLPDVDPKRIGVTGASGGGTQTFILCAIDPRPALAFPAVMVSTAMQGGCSCENASGLRIGTGNVEFAALFAPKPLGLTTANDWTKEMSTQGFPQLEGLYRLLRQPEHLKLTRGEQFGHNYNAVSRTAMYAWVNQHFDLGSEPPIVERDYLRLTRAELSVWDDAHPRPPGGPEFERHLLHALHEDTERLIDRASRTPAAFRRILGRGAELVVGRTWDEVGGVEWIVRKAQTNRESVTATGLFRNRAHAEELPGLMLRARKGDRRVAIWLDSAGKAGLFADGVPRPEVRRLLDARVSVVGVDLFLQGEFLADGQPVTETRRVANPRDVPAFTFGYNSSVFAQRVQDVLTVVKAIRQLNPPPDEVWVVGLNGTGPLAVAARAVARGAIDRMAVDTGGFRFGHVLDWRSPDFLPGGARYGDLPGFLALGATGATWVAGETAASLEWARRAYGFSGSQRRLVTFAGPAADTSKAAVEWFLNK